MKDEQLKALENLLNKARAEARAEAFEEAAQTVEGCDRDLMRYQYADAIRAKAKGGAG